MNDKNLYLSYSSMIACFAKSVLYVCLIRFLSFKVLYITQGEYLSRITKSLQNKLAKCISPVN